LRPEDRSEHGDERSREERRQLMARLKITQTRSEIGSKDNQRQTLRSLGLKRVRDVVVKEDRPEIRGMVQTVTHLVAVEEVE
jgi:large subunit ribosomal protein L30